jgi:hypothetical protein
MKSDWRPEFEQAMGETFAECLSPPIPFEEADVHDCCEVIWEVFGDNVTPAELSQATGAQLEALRQEFFRYFEREPITTEQITEAIERTLARWPVGSLGEMDRDANGQDQAD